MYCPLCDESLARISVDRSISRRVLASLRLRKALYCHECRGHFSVRSRQARLAFVGLFILPALIIASTGPARWVETKLDVSSDNGVRQAVRFLYMPIRNAPVLGNLVEDWMDYWGALAQTQPRSTDEASYVTESIRSAKT